MMTYFQSSIDTWKEVWGTGYYQYLFLAALFYLLLRYKRMKQAGLLLAYAMAALFIFFFPPTSAIIQKCIDDAVYFRYFWIIPVMPILAYVMTDLIAELKTKGTRFGAVILCMGLLAVSGKCILSSEYFHEAGNRFKLPQEIIAISDLITEDAAGEHIVLCADEHVSSYIRIYNPDIEMRYGRWGSGAATRYDKVIHNLLDQPGSDIVRLMKYLNAVPCNYFVIHYTDAEKQDKYLSTKGCVKLGDVNWYGVYRFDGIPGIERLIEEKP